MLQSEFLMTLFLRGMITSTILVGFGIRGHIITARGYLLTVGLSLRFYSDNELTNSDFTVMKSSDDIIEIACTKQVRLSDMNML